MDIIDLLIWVTFTRLQQVRVSFKKTGTVHRQRHLQDVQPAKERRPSPRTGAQTTSPFFSSKQRSTNTWLFWNLPSQLEFACKPQRYLGIRVVADLWPFNWHSTWSNRSCRNSVHCLQWKEGTCPQVNVDFCVCPQKGFFDTRQKWNNDPLGKQPTPPPKKIYKYLCIKYLK